MFGREPERAQVEQALEQVATGPSGLALEGLPGIGKSTIWREGVELARARGLRVLATAPSEPDSGLAFSGLGDLFDRLDDELVAGLPGPQRRALDAALSLVESDAAPVDPQALPRAALSLLRGLAARLPLLVAIDDEQWLDRASARVLAFALCRLSDEHVCVLIARRPQTDTVLWPELARGYGSRGLPVLTVEPLDLLATGRLLASRLGRTVARPVLRRIHEASGGNPLYALAISRELEKRSNGQAGAGELPIPATLADAVAQRLGQLDSRAMDPLLAAAAVSQPTLALLQSALPEFAPSDLDSAEQARVIELDAGRVRFTHPLLASTHYASAPASHRSRMHRLLAEVLDDEEQCAYHLARGAEAPDREVAATIELAAGAAARRGAPESAAVLLEHAARLTPADAVEARNSRLISAAALHYKSANATRTRELLEPLVTELPAGPTRARVLVQLSEARTDDWELCEQMMRQALVEAGDNDRLRCECESWLSGLLSNRGEFAEMLLRARSAADAAERAGDARLRALAAAGLASALCMNGRPVDFDALERAGELEEPGSITTYYSPSGFHAQIQFWIDDYASARPALHRMLQRSRERGEEYDVGAFLIELSVLEYYAGNRDAAAEHLDAAEDAVRDQGSPALDLWLNWAGSLLTAGRGELESARTRAQAAVTMGEGMGDRLITALPTIVLASVELWTGNPERAHTLLGPLRESFLMKGFGLTGSLTLGMWSCDVEALIACGRLDEAQPIVEDLLRRARATDNPNAAGVAERCRGLLLAARGDVSGAIDAMAVALAEHARRPLAPEIARTLLERGVVLRRAKQKTAAKQSLDEALAMWEQIGAPMWVARTRDELGRIGLRRAAVSDGMTPAQARVMELVAAGMTNREIASTLYMSSRSVESHLTKVYREMGVKSRAQLVAALAARADTSGDEARDAERVSSQ